MSTDFQEIGLSHRVHRLRESLGDLFNSGCVRMIIHPLLKYRAGEIGLSNPLPIIKRHNVGGHCVRLLFDIAPAAGKLQARMFLQEEGSRRCGNWFQIKFFDGHDYSYYLIDHTTENPAALALSSILIVVRRFGASKQMGLLKARPPRLTPASHGSLLTLVAESPLRCFSNLSIVEGSSSMPFGLRRKALTPARQASASQSSPVSIITGVCRRCGIACSRSTNSKPLKPGRSLSTIIKS